MYEGLYNDYQTATNLTHDVYAAYSGSNGFLNNVRLMRITMLGQHLVGVISMMTVPSQNIAS